MKLPARVDWAESATRLAAKISRTQLHPAVLTWAAGRSPRERWAVAFSGGADSLALVLLLWAHWPERRERLRCLHFNHRLRGAAARADELFCGKVCQALGVEFQAGRWAKARAGSSEAQARAARFEFFQEELRTHRTRVLWLGHQQDDIAESLLMRLARGSGSAGLAAPRPIQVMRDGRMHVRPLLTLKKREVVSALKHSGAIWREDASNVGEEFFRNRVRRSVLPAWTKAAGRDALAGAALTRELLEEDDAALERWVDEVDALDDAGRLDLRKLEGKPRALVRRALHRWLLSQNDAGELVRQGFERLLDAAIAARDTRQSLGADSFAVVRRGQLQLVRSRAVLLEKTRRIPRPPN